MVTLGTRIILLTIFTVIGILLIKNGDPSAWFYFSVDIIILLEYLRSGSMWPAYQAFKLQDYKILRRRLRETFFPKLLGATHRAMYYYLKGASEIQRGNYSSAEKYFHIALKQKKTPSTDKGMIYGFLATIALQKKDVENARKFLQKAEQEQDSMALTQMKTNLRQKLKEAK